MHNSTTPNSSPDLPRRALIAGGSLFFLETLLIGALFKHGIDFECLENWPKAACAGASGTMIALYCVIGTVLLLAFLRPQPWRELFSEAGDKKWPLAVNGIGFLISLIPVFLLQEGTGSAAVLPAFLLWSAGMSMMLLGILIYAAPVRKWRSFFAQEFLTLLPIMVAGAALPYMATLIRPLWRMDTIIETTFNAVAFCLELLGYDVVVPEGTKVIGADNFFVNVAPTCSGVEGIALVSLFVSIYLWLFRADLRFPRALLLYPIGLFASALFNVFRITLLLVIGIEGNPELAIGGFHSHAGWLMFTLVALGIVALSQSLSWLKKEPAFLMAASGGAPSAQAEPLPFFKDPVVAQIFPFATFMFSALLAQAFTQSPGLVYPLRALAMGAALAIFFSIYMRLPWRLDPIACAVGAAIGIIWVVIPTDAGDGAPPFGDLTGVMLTLWFVMRGLGTVVFVPIIEELFFRGYLESRLRLKDGLVWKVIAAVATAGLFAALHDRWAEAFLAGLAFSWVVQRQGGRLTDAVIAHAVANLIVFAVAGLTGQMHII